MIKILLIISAIFFHINVHLYADPIDVIEQRQSAFSENLTYDDLQKQFESMIASAKEEHLIENFSSEEEQKEIETEAKKELEKKYKLKNSEDFNNEQQKELKEKIVELNKAHMLRKVDKINSLSQYFKSLPTAKSDQLERVKIQPYVFDDGRIFKGDPGTAVKTLHQILFGPKSETTSTESGRIRAAKELANPCRKSSDIIERQKRIKFLLDNPEKLDELEQILKRISTLEQDFLDLKYREERVAKEEKIFLKKDWLWNTDYLSIMKETQEIAMKSGDPFAIAIAPGIGNIKYAFMKTFGTAANRTDTGSITLNILAPWILGTSILALYSVGAFAFAYSMRRIPIVKYYFMFGGALFGFLLFTTIKKNISDMQKVLEGQRTLCKMRQLKDCMEELCVLVDQDFLPAVADLESFLDMKNEDQKLNDLLKRLDSSTFSGESSVFSHHGKTIRTFILFEDLREKFTSALEIVGQVDFYVSIAKLYKRLQTGENRFCFPEIIESEHTLFECQGMWNPFIGPEIAISADICLGLDSQNKKIGAIVSGPNFGGKSVYLSEILFCVILTQSCGISPCKSCRIVPFDELETYISIKDNPPKESLFSAQCTRLNSVVNSARNADKQKRKKLLIGDEPLTGTKVLYAEELVNAIIGKLAQFDNCIFIFATHFDSVVDNLDQTSKGRFENRQVLANLDKDGLFESPRFQVGPGRSRADAALKVAQSRFNEENMDIIEDAKSRVITRIKG